MTATVIQKSIEKKPREGWSEAFSQMSKNKDDVLLLDDNIDSDDFEWVW